MLRNLSNHLWKEELAKEISGIKIFQEGPFFSHLAFANDLLLFRRATKKKVRGFDFSGRVL